jgi:hypothetical protein
LEQTNRTHKMPLITVRWSRHCPPRRPSLLGSSGAVALHASSVNSPRPAIVSPVLCLVQNEGNTSRLICQASPACTHVLGVYVSYFHTIVRPRGRRSCPATSWSEDRSTARDVRGQRAGVWRQAASVRSAGEVRREAMHAKRQREFTAVVQVVLHDVVEDPRP